MDDFYATLGVDRHADAAEIKRAYRRMSRRHHPDKGGSNAKMAEINRAYAVLANPRTRSAYDRGESPQPEQSKESRAEAGIYNIAFQILQQQPNTPDFIAAIRNSINTSVIQHRTVIVEAPKQLKKALKRLKRIKGGPLFEYLARNLEDSSNNAVKNAQESLEIAELALKMLKAYTDQGPEIDPAENPLLPMFRVRGWTP